MVKSLLLIAFRNFKKQKFFSLINIMGLSIGLGIAVVIINFIVFEESFDTFYPSYHQIYRVAHVGAFNGNKIDAANSPLPEAPVILEDIPEVAVATRFYDMPENTIVKVKESKFLESDVFLTDSLFFNVFEIAVNGADPKAILGTTSYAYLSENTAKRYFGNQNAIGQVIEIRGKALTVAGTFHNFPANSHFHPEVITNLKLLFSSQELEEWGAFSNLTYIRLKDGSNVDTVQSKIRTMFYNRIGKMMATIGVTFTPYLQPITDIHLRSSLMGEIEPNGDYETIYIFSVITFLILLIAIANYMNLSTARFSKRAKEVGIRKVSGARRGMLSMQFLSESIILAFISLGIALYFAELLSPLLGQLLQRKISIEIFTASKVFKYYLPIAFATGLIAGSYPAYFLSSFKPISTLIGKVGDAKRSVMLRKVLTLSQLFITIGLIICTTTVYRQLQYLNNKNLGFNKENILVLRLTTSDAVQKATLLKEKMIAIPGVVSITATSSYPGEVNHGEGFVPEGFDTTQTTLMFRQDVDYEYFNTIGATMHSGRFFSKEFPTDSNAALINQTAMKLFGWKDAVGKTIRSAGGNLHTTIIGVYNNMNFLSLHDPVQPAIIFLDKQPPAFLLIHINGDPTEIIKNGEKIWNNLLPDNPYHYSFLDEELAKNYLHEKMMGRAFLLLTALAILIANMGLLGLSIFNAERRRKEISVRKVLGANKRTIAILFLKEYGMQVVFASLASWPIAYYLMQHWLNNFPYRTTLSVWAFIGSSAIASLTVLLVVGYTIVKVANTNPSDSLKYE